MRPMHVKTHFLEYELHDKHTACYKDAFSVFGLIYHFVFCMT